MTNVTLSKRPGVLIPLVPMALRKNLTALGGMVITARKNAGSLFAPLTLPLFGRIDDIGFIQDLETDENVKFLGRRFRDPGLSRFLPALMGKTFPPVTRLAHRASPSHRKSPLWDGTLSACWASREAWEMFSTAVYDERGRKRIGPDEILEWMDRAQTEMDEHREHLREWKTSPTRRMQSHLHPACTMPIVGDLAPEMWWLYQERLLKGTLRDPAIKLFMFLSNLYGANRMLMPPVGGWQCGAPGLQADVARLALKMAREKRNWNP